MKKGFMRAIGDPQSIWQLIGELNDAGVSTHSITVGEEFGDALSSLSSGDHLVVPRLEMISSQSSHLPLLIRDVLSRGASLEVLDCPWVGSRPPASERAGTPSKTPGRKPGRPAGDNLQIMSQCVALYKSSQISIREICEQLGCSERTIYRYIRKSRQSDSSLAGLPYRSRGRKSHSVTDRTSLQ